MTMRLPGEQSAGSKRYIRRRMKGICVRSRSHGPAVPGIAHCAKCQKTRHLWDRSHYRVSDRTTRRGMVRVSTCAALLVPACTPIPGRCAPMRHDRGACAPHNGKAKR